GLDAQKSRSQNYGLLIEEDGRLEKIRQQRLERNKEYNEYLARKRQYQRHPLGELTDEYKALALGANESDAVK
ncbi:unnamed protein product, partial [Candidula unifasciata]